MSDIYCTWCESDDLEDHRFEECGYYALQREAELKKRLAESEETVKNVNRANDDMLKRICDLRADLAEIENYIRSLSIADGRFRVTLLKIEGLATRHKETK